MMAKRYKKLTARQIRALANEESKAAKMYHKYGFWRFARDEAKHANFFKRLAKKARK